MITVYIIDNKSINRYRMRLTMTKLYRSEFDNKHAWVTVVNPLNQRSLLQACDDCGVVKSENSVIRQCHASKGAGLISEALTAFHAQAS